MKKETNGHRKGKRGRGTQKEGRKGRKGGRE